MVSALSEQRLRFALRYALRHALVSLLVAGLSALFVFGLLYPPPTSAMLGVGSIFLLLLGVDVVCGPLLTLLLANPAKPRRERWLDFFAGGPGAACSAAVWLAQRMGGAPGGAGV